MCLFLGPYFFSSYSKKKKLVRPTSNKSVYQSLSVIHRFSRQETKYKSNKSLFRRKTQYEEFTFTQWTFLISRGPDKLISDRKNFKIKRSRDIDNLSPCNFKFVKYQIRVSTLNLISNFPIFLTFSDKSLRIS